MPDPSRVDRTLRSVISAITPRLKRLGFARHGTRFKLVKAENELALVLRRSHRQPTSIQVTFDAQVVSARLREWAKTRRIWMPPWHTDWRLGSLAFGEDRWWIVEDDMSSAGVDRLAKEIADAVSTALPFLRANMTDEAIRHSLMEWWSDRSSPEWVTDWLEALDPA